MLIIYCCIMNYPKLSGTVSVPPCDSGSGSPVKLQSRSRSGLLSHLKAQLGLKGSLPRWCTNMPGKFMLVLGRRPQFLSMCTSPGGCLSILRAWGLIPLLRMIDLCLPREGRKACPVPFSVFLCWVSCTFCGFLLSFIPGCLTEGGLYS